MNEAQLRGMREIHAYVKESKVKIYAVYYSKNPTFVEGVKIGDLSKTHQYLGFMGAGGLEDLFVKMQGESWSPQGEARGLIKHLGLKHTSMSVGDVVLDVLTGEWWECAGAGWNVLGNKEDRL